MNPDIGPLMRTNRYIGLLVLAAILGVLVSVAAYGYLQLVSSMQRWMYQDLPSGVGLSPVPLWWPLIPLLLAGVVVGLTIRHLPGRGGEVPVDGFRAGAVPKSADLPGIAIAALASISLGAVVGPEGPLVALGGGTAVLVVRLARRGLPRQAAAVIASIGSFAAISTLLGSPLAGAFLLMEAAGLAGATATAVLLPGLLGAGVGALIFTGLGTITGHGTFSLAIPDLPKAGRPTWSEIGWALVIGLAAAVLCRGLRAAATVLRGPARDRVLPVTVLVALAVAGLAIGYDAATSHPASDVLFSGQSELPSLIEHSAGYSVAALLLLMVCKGLSYAGCLAAFRGGPTFPAMFLGAAGGMAMSHLPGLALVPAAAMGVGAMSACMLRLPLTAALLTTLFFGNDGITVMPLVILAVVVAYITTVRLNPPPDRATEPAPTAAPA
jgi:H+/Cl- antiporter ClcA